MIYTFEHTMFTLDIKSQQMRNTVYRPILEITLTNGPHRVACCGLVDSGADYCQFPSRLIAELGLAPNEDRVISISPGSEAHAQIHTLQIILPRHPEIRPIETPIAFVDHMNEGWHLGEAAVGLLGQNGFFDQFVVRFDSRNRRFVLEPYEV